MRNILAGSRFFIAIAVLGTFVSSVALIVSGTISVFKVTWDALSDGDTGVTASKHLAVDFLQLVDIFLLQLHDRVAIVLLVAAAAERICG